MKYTPLLALRREREQRGWSRNYVAERIEVDVITVGRWERGERMPHPHHRQKLCALFEMSAHDLGLLSTLLEETDDAITIKDSSLEASTANTVIPQFTLQVTAKKEEAITVSFSPIYHRRKFLLAGLGGIGTLAIVGSSTLLLAFRSSSASSPTPTPTEPLSMPSNKRSHHFLDLNTSNFVNYMVWSPDNGDLAVATGSNVISIWNIAKETLVLYYPTLNGWVNDISWSKTNIIAAATADFHSGSLQLWNYPNPKPIFTLQRSYGLRSVSWSPDSKHLALSGHIPTVEVWDPFLAHIVSQYSYPALGPLGIRRVKWSPAGRFLACATDDGTAHVWEALTGKPRTIYHGHNSRLIDLSWSPDGQYVVTGGNDKTCQIWDAASGRNVLIYRGHTNIVEAVAWSPHGNFIASGSDDHTVHLWEARTGKLITKYEGRQSIVEAILWSLDGTSLVIGTEKEGVEIWQVPSN